VDARRRIGHLSDKVEGDHPAKGAWGLWMKMPEVPDRFIGKRTSGSSRK